MRQMNHIPLLTLSVRLYRALLIFYPADYRREYGTLMVQFFRDVAWDRYQSQGWLGIMLWWCATLFDLTKTVLEQRRKVSFEMSKAAFMQMTGWLLIVGGICCALAGFSQLQPDDHYSYYGVYQLMVWLLAPGFLFIGLGCIGLALRYQQALGTLGYGTLTLSGVGALMISVGGVVVMINDTLWNVGLWGVVLYTVALLAFALLHLWTPTLPVFRALPLQIASGGLVILLGFTKLFSQPVDNLLSFLMVLGTGLAWLAIGLSMNRQQKDAGLTTA